MRLDMSHGTSTNNLKRINDLADLVRLQYDKLYTFERRLAVVSDVSQEFELQHRIRHDILPPLRRHEAELAALLSSTATKTIPEDEAATLVDKMLEEASVLRATFPNLHSNLDSARAVSKLEDELTKLEHELTKPGIPASTKLKISLPLIPLVVTYEIEIGTNYLMLNVWERIKELFIRSVPDPQ
jgi:hypothetical protein